MDNRATNQIPDRDLFSRGSTPPIASQPSLQQQYSNSHNTSPNQIDSLFHNIGSSSDHHSDTYLNSEPATPIMTSSDEQPQQQQPPQIPPSISTSSADRQSALLSLLSGPANPPRGAPAVNPQQVPTPPSASTRSNASPTHNETQGKILLEQLMSG
jgi:hypothetical protein